MASINDTPTPAQQGVLWLALDPDYGGEGEFGPLGVDERPYFACLDRGWLVEVPVERPKWMGPGTRARITDAGRAAFARAQGAKRG